MVTMYLRALRMGCHVANLNQRASGRSFLTLCATPIQHKTEENQSSLNTTKPTKSPAENMVQDKMNSSPCATQKMQVLQLKMNELDQEYRTLQASLLLAVNATKIESAAKTLFATMRAHFLLVLRSCSPGDIEGLDSNFLMGAAICLGTVKS